MTGSADNLPSGPAGVVKFEDALGRLEAVLQRLESGDLPLEASLSLFEEGVRLAKLCQERLDEAERKVTLLMRDAEGREEEVPFVEGGVEGD